MSKGKILIISYFYPPCNLTGAKRPSIWSKHLSNFGYTPVVITAPWNNKSNDFTHDYPQENTIKKIHNENEPVIYTVQPKRILKNRKVIGALTNKLGIIRRLISFIELILQNISIVLSQYYTFYKVADKLIQKDSDIKGVIISGMPFNQFYIGYKLKKKHPNILWIPDYRDEWTSRPNFEKNFTNWFFNLYDRYFEKKWTSNANFFTYVDETYLLRIQKLINKKGFVISNIAQKKEPINRNPKHENGIVLTFAGTLYKHQNIDFLANGIKQFLAENQNSKITINFIGSKIIKGSETWINSVFPDHPNLTLNITKRVPEEEIINYYKISDALIMFPIKNMSGIVPTKVLNYLYLEIPILFVPTDKGAIHKLINNSSTGYTPIDENELLSVLETLDSKERHLLSPNFDYLDYLSPQKQVEKLAINIDNELIDVHKINGLILCYDFPPLRSIGGIRPYEWQNLMPNFGITPIVVTRSWNDDIKSERDLFKEDINPTYLYKSESKFTLKVKFNKNWKADTFDNKFLTVVRKGYTIISSILKWNFSFFDDRIHLYKEADKFLLENKKNVKFILATGEPYVLFKYANKLSKKHNIPYILDYRDGWSCDHATLTGIHKKIRGMEFKYEKKYLTEATNYTVAAEYIRNKNNVTFNLEKGLVHENGISLHILKSLEKNRPKTHFQITYTGSLYPEHDIKSFLDACQELISEKSLKIKVQFIGVEIKPSTSLAYLKDFIKYAEDWIDIIEPVELSKSIQYQLDSHLLLKFDFTGQNEGLLGAKMYEYAATKNKILTVLSINDKRSNFYPNKNIQCMSFGKLEIKETIFKLYNDWIEEKQIESDLTNEDIISFSREKSIEELSNWLKKIFNA